MHTSSSFAFCFFCCKEGFLRFQAINLQIFATQHSINYCCSNRGFFGFFSPQLKSHFIFFSFSVFLNPFFIPLTGRTDGEKKSGNFFVASSNLTLLILPRERSRRPERITACHSFIREKFLLLQFIFRRDQTESFRELWSKKKIGWSGRSPFWDGD